MSENLLRFFIHNTLSQWQCTERKLSRLLTCNKVRIIFTEKEAFVVLKIEGGKVLQLRAVHATHLPTLSFSNKEADSMMNVVWNTTPHGSD